MMLALCVGTVWSAPGHKLPGQDLFKEIQLSEKGKQLMKEMSSDARSTDACTAPGETILAKKVTRAADGSKTMMQITKKSLKWCDILLFGGEQVSFEDFPYYWVSLTIGTVNEEETAWIDRYDMPLLWPSRSLYYSMIGMENDENCPATIEDFTSHPDQWNTFEYVGRGTGFGYGEGTWPVANPSWTDDVAVLDGNMYNLWDVLADADSSYIHLNPSAVGDEVAVEAEMRLNSNGDWAYNTERRYSYDGKGNDVGIEKFDFPQIYLVGEPQEWNIDGNLIPIKRVSKESRVYKGRVFVPEGQFNFRFYGDMGDWDSYSIGSQNYDDNMMISLDGGYTGSLFVGDEGSGAAKGKWDVESWPGGVVDITVDLDNSTVSFESIGYPETMYTFGTVAGQDDPMPLEGIGNGIYTGAFDFYGGMQFAFTDTKGLILASDDYYNRTAFGKNSALCAIRPYNNSYYWTLVSYINTKRIEVTLDLVERVVTFRDPDYVFDPSAFSMTFSENNPETLEYYVENGIRIEYPSGMLMGDELAMEFSKNADLGVSRNDDYCMLYVTPKEEGELTVKVSTKAYQSGLGSDQWLATRTFNVVKTDWSAIIGDNISAEVYDSETGESESGTLSKTEDGIYTGTFDFTGDKYLQLKFTDNEGKNTFISVKNPNGDILIDNTWFNLGELYLNSLHAARGEVVITDRADLWKPMYDGRLDVKLDINNRTIYFSDPDYKISFEFPEEVKVMPWDWTTFEFKSNVRDGSLYFVPDNEDIAEAWYAGYSSENDTYRIDVNGREEGETDLHIYLDGYGEVGVIHVVCAYFAPESITLSNSSVVLQQGEYAKVYVATEPVRYSFWASEADGCEVFTCDNKYLLILANTVGEYDYTVICGANGVRVTADLKVTVLPKDASLAEHIVYTRVQPGESARFLLDDHKDGSAATATWRSSDPAVAEVDSKGNVTALTSGRAVITADCGGHVAMSGIHVESSVEADEIDADALTVYSLGTDIMVAGLADGKTVNVFAADGSLLLTRKGDGSTLRLPVGVKGAFVVSAAGHSYKVVL